MQESGLKARGARRLRGCRLLGGARADRGGAAGSRRFADLYEANFERVYAYVIRRVRDRDEAQDITADVFHLALKSLPRFEWRGVPFAAWLFRIAANEIADRSKSIAKRRAHELFLFRKVMRALKTHRVSTRRSGGGGCSSWSSGCRAINRASS